MDVLDYHVGRFTRRLGVLGCNVAWVTMCVNCSCAKEFQVCFVQSHMCAGLYFLNVFSDLGYNVVMIDPVSFSGFVVVDCTC